MHFIWSKSIAPIKSYDERNIELKVVFSQVPCVLLRKQTKYKYKCCIHHNCQEKEAMDGD